MLNRKILILFLSILLCGVCQAQINELKSKIAQTSNKTEKIARLIEIADVYRMIDTDSALYYSNVAMDLILNQEHSVEQQIKVLVLKSDIFCLNGDFDKAIHYAESAKELAGTISNRKSLAFVKLAFANIYIALSFYDNAYDNCMSALQLFQLENDLRGQQKCYTYLASLSIGFSKYEEAIGYFKKALSLAEQIDEKLLLACSLMNLGTGYGYSKNNEKAFEYFNKSLDISEKYNLTILLIYNYTNYALFYIDSNQPDLSEIYCQKAIQIAQKSKNWRSLCIAMNACGLNKNNQEKYKEALYYAHKADSIGRHLELIDELSKSSRLLSDSYEKMGSNDSALKYYKEYSTYKDSLYSRQNQINVQRIKFEYQMKEKMIAQKHMNQIIALAVALLVLTLVVIILRYLRSVRKNKQTIRKIETELDTKKREITSKMVYIQKKNEEIASIAGKLEESKLFSGKHSTYLIDHAIKELSTNAKNDSWEEFELRFKEVDPDFFKKLSVRFPHLTPNDKKLCAYLKLNLSTKEIASLLNLSVNSVLSARYRLRKKLNINKEDTSINQFLDSL